MVATAPQLAQVERRAPSPVSCDVGKGQPAGQEAGPAAVWGVGTSSLDTEGKSSRQRVIGGATSRKHVVDPELVAELGPVVEAEVARLRARMEAALVAEYARQTNPAVPGGKSRWWCTAFSRLDSLYRWHESRIQGLVRTAQSLVDCAEGERRKVLACHGCQHEWSVPWTCDNTLLCPSCRQVASSRRAKQVRDQVAGIAAERAGSAARLRMVTVTVPHVEQLEQRVAVAFKAKTAFFRSLNEWTQLDGERRDAKASWASGEVSDDTEAAAVGSDTPHDTLPGEASPAAESGDPEDVSRVAHWDALEVTAGAGGLRAWARRWPAVLRRQERFCGGRGLTVGALGVCYGSTRWYLCSRRRAACIARCGAGRADQEVVAPCVGARLPKRPVGVGRVALGNMASRSTVVC